MSETDWFDDIAVVGGMDDNEIEFTVVDEEATRSGGWGFWKTRLYMHTQHTFGYIPSGHVAADETIPIQNAGTVTPDQSLIGESVTVALDRMMIQDYPGRGEHTVLFDFYAQNHVEEGEEDLHFNQVYRGRDGQLTGAVGYPIFVGLNVGKQGITFKGFSVNVSNKNDEAFLTFLDSPAFKGGLKLATKAQPAIGLVSETALQLTRMVAKRNRNVPVQNFYLGLDFSDVVTRAKLREGSYVVVQTNEVWDWSQWQFYPQSGRIGRVNDPTQTIPFNYIVFSVSRTAV